MNRLFVIALLIVAGSASAEEFIHYVQGERLEYHSDDDSVLWDIRGDHGGDLHRFAWKTEGHYGTVLDHGEIQLLYKRAWSPFFNLQVGFRQERVDNVDRSSAVMGVEGEAPYDIEIDASLFVTNDGDVLLRAEFERDILLTQQLVIQPRAELNASFQDNPQFQAEAGVNDLTIDLRLRYEVTRKFAPYLGVSHERLFDFDMHQTSLVAGIRFWF